jgi:hypothetical protein
MLALLIELKCIPEIECLRKWEEEGEVVERRGGRYGKAEQRVTLVVVSSRGTNTVLVLAATAIVSHFYDVILSFLLLLLLRICFEENKENRFACVILCNVFWNTGFQWLTRG